MHGYLAFYGNREVEVYASSLFEAKTKAVAHFKVSPKKTHLVSVYLCEKDVNQETGKGTQVYHSTVSF